VQQVLIVVQVHVKVVWDRQVSCFVTEVMLAVHQVALAAQLNALCGTLILDMHAALDRVTEDTLEMCVAVNIPDIQIQHHGVLIQITCGHKVLRNIHLTVDLADSVVLLNGQNKVAATTETTGLQDQDITAHLAAADIVGEVGVQAVLQS